MFKRIEKIRREIESKNPPPYRRKEWLSSPYKDLLWRLELNFDKQPSEMLDDVALWDGDLKLKKALEDHCHWMPQYEDSSGKWIQKERKFTDVILCLPDHIFREVIIHESGRLDNLLKNLAWHHKKDYPESLPEGREPRYLARPDSQLENHNVVFLFGRSIYIPDPEESAFQVVVSLNGSNVILPNLEYWRNGNSYQLSNGFYSGQECMLFVPQQGEGLISIPGWQASDEKAYLLLRRIGQKWDANLWDSGHYAPLNLPKITSAGIWYFTIPLNDHKILTLKIAPQQEATAQHNASCTIIPPGDLPNPVSPYALELETVGLPFLFNDLQQWTLWFDPEGGFASSAAIMQQQQRPLACLSLNQNGLIFTDEAGVSKSLGTRISRKRNLRLSAATLTLLPSPADLTHFVGLLKLPVPPSYPVSENPTMIGRLDPNDPNYYPEIILDQLDQPDSVRGPVFSQGNTLNNIGLSRRHAQVRVIGECLEVKLESPNNRLFRLDKNRQRPEMRHSSADPLTLNLGDYLVVGNFLLRFKKTGS